MTYKLDLTKLNIIKQRAVVTDLKFTTPGLLLVMIFEYFAQRKDHFQMFLIISLSLIPLTIIRLLFKFRNFREEVKSYELILSREGIMQKLQGRKPNEIGWTNVKYEIKPNNAIKITDKTVSSSKGTFLIIPEIENRQELLTELQKYCGQV